MWALLGAGALFAAALGGCGKAAARRVMPGGDAELGRAAIQKYGCGNCHIVPGIPGAEGRTAQPLLGFAYRGDIASYASNTPDNLVKWLTKPTVLNPRAKMPELGVSEKDARDIGAYLYTLGQE
jgi:cytochrome c2